MKNKKILFLIIGLIIISLSVGVSYAWFASNQNISIDSIEVEAAAVAGLEISADADNWFGSISLTDLTSASYIGNRNLIPSAEILPSSSPKTVTNGMLDIRDGLVYVPETDYLLEADQATDPSASATIAAASTSGNYFAFDLFLKTAKDQDVYLSNLSGVSANGTDSGLKNSVRIAILNQGTAATKEDAILLVGATDDDVWLWEPNVNAHTQTGQVNANTTFLSRTGGNVGATTIIPSYDAIYADVALTDLMGIGETTISQPTKLTLMTPGDIDYQTKVAVGGVSEMASGSPIVASVLTGITKLRVYLWIEGQDVDCENGSTGTSIDFNLQFSGEGKPKTYLRGAGYDGLGSTADVFWDVKESITSITFEDEINIPYGATYWDISQTLNFSVLAYIIDDGLNNNTYKLYIQSNGLMYAPPTMSHYFRDFPILTAIYNLHLLNTSNVTTLTWLFSNSYAITSIDLSSFDTSNVEDMTAMFSHCHSLTSVNLKSFNTSKVEYMGSLFDNCNSLTSVDLNSFDTSSVTDMSWMFNACGLVNVSIGHFITANVTDMYAMFANNTGTIISIDFKSAVFNITIPADYEYMFLSITSGVDIRVKDATAKNWIEARLSDVYRSGNVHT